MQKELVIAIFGGLGAMLGWGLADFFAKKTIDEVGDIVSLVWAHIFGTSILVFVALFQAVVLKKPVTFPHALHAWGLLAFFGVLQAIVYLLVYKGFGKGQVAVLNPVFASFSGIVAVISIVVFGEKTNIHKLLAFGIIFAGILLISLDMQALRSKRIVLGKIPGLKEVGLATILAAVWTLGWDKFVGGKDWVSYALCMYAFMTIAVCVVAKIQRIPLSKVKPHIWKFLIFIGICEVVAYLSLSLGYSTTSLTSVVALISGAFSLPTIILARIFLKEKVAFIQTFGTVVIIAGIILLAL